MTPPNILYIHSHDTGRYIQPYGANVPTPNLQRLAGGGVVFRQNFCCNPTCSASRAALLTGEYPHQNGMLGLAHRGWALYDYGRHLVHTLAGAGYATALAGVQHVAADRSVIGYDRLLDPERPAQEAAADYLRGGPEAPFFLAVGFQETHRAFPAPGPEDDPRWCAPPRPLPDTPRTREDMAAFRASARALDEKMGVVFAALEEAGLAESTLVVCTTDHGIAFPRMKCTLTDGGTGTLLILRGPGGFTGGRVVDGLTSHIDIFPTLCEVAGIEPPGWLQGVSLAPLGRGEAGSVREEVFAELNYHACYDPQRSVRTERYKYIRRYEERRRPCLPNLDRGPSKDCWLDGGWRDDQTQNAPEELYDLLYDPTECRNLAAEPAYANVLEEHRRRLARWQRETDDPLLAGPIPPPVGALVNDPNGTHPSGEYYYRVTDTRTP